MIRKKRGKMVRKVLKACFVFFLIGLLSCDDHTDSKKKHNNRAFNNFKESNSRILKHSSSIVTATITRTMPGRAINNYNTMMISIDKGSEDGVYVGLEGFFLVHKAAINAFRVLEVNRNTAIMEGWYYPNIHEQATILLTFGNVSSQAVWDYIKSEGIKAPAWEDF